MIKTFAAMFLTAAVSVPASAATWVHDTNEKNGNHYIVIVQGPLSLTFACREKTIIAFYSVPTRFLAGTPFEKAKTLYTIAAVDQGEIADSRYSWFAGPVDESEPDTNANLGPEGRILDLLRDVAKAKTEAKFGISVENPAKGRFQMEYATAFPVDGASSAIAEFFQACKFKL